MNNKCIFLALATALFGLSIQAQLTFKGYSEIYYTHDFNATSSTRDAWFYNHNLHNTIAPNLALLETRYKGKNAYAQLDLMFGTYSSAIMVNEPFWAQPIAQAYVGTKYKRFNFEAGIFESGIGLEGIKGSDNPTLTRSIVAENTPYYLSGVRARWEDRTAIFLIEGAIINGWETVTRHAPESNPGVMARFRLGSEKVRLHYHFMYTDDRGGLASPITGMINGFAFKHALNSWQWFLGYDNIQWNGDAIHLPHIIVRKEFSERWAAALRGEYVMDNSQTPFFQNLDDLGATSIRSFEGFGGSFNIDYMPYKDFTLRAEIRHIDGKMQRDFTSFRPGNVNIGVNNMAQLYGNTALTIAACLSF